MLGDNIFHGAGRGRQLSLASESPHGAPVCSCVVAGQTGYGVVGVDDAGRVLLLDEKPTLPKSHLADTGVYFHDDCARELAADLVPSPRGALEITDRNRRCLDGDTLRVARLGRGRAWLDAGTPLLRLAVRYRTNRYDAYLERVVHEPHVSSVPWP